MHKYTGIGKKKQTKQKNTKFAQKLNLLPINAPF